MGARPARIAAAIAAPVSAGLTGTRVTLDGRTYTLTPKED